MQQQHRPLANQLGFWLHRLSAAVRTDHTLLLAHLDLGLLEAWALQLLHDGAAQRPTELAAVLGIDPAAVTRMISKLAGRGLVVRNRQEDDLRSVRLELTAAGTALAVASADILVRAESQLTDDLTAVEAHALVSRLIARLERTGWDLEDV